MNNGLFGNFKLGDKDGWGCHRAARLMLAAGKITSTLKTLTNGSQSGSCKYLVIEFHDGQTVYNRS